METKITTVAAQGEAEAPFTLARFNVQLTAFGETVPLAKTRLADAVSYLNVVVSDLKMEQGVEIVKNSLRTSSSVQDKHEYNNVVGKNVFVGHNINYIMSFEVDDLDQVSVIYDVLTSLNVVDPVNVKLTVGTPICSLKNRDRVNKRALKNAFKKVQERFETECEVLGLEPGSFEIITWEASYSDSQRSDRVAQSAHTLSGRVGTASGPSGGSADVEICSPQFGTASLNLPAIEFNVGLANVVVNLEVGYIRRAPTPVNVVPVRTGNHSVSESKDHANV